jgi:hypothetical protein
MSEHPSARLSLAKRIVIEFRDTTRTPARTEYMSAEDAASTFDALARALEDAGPEGDGWIRAGITVVIRAREVHNIWLEEYVDLSGLFRSGGDSFWDKTR